MSKGHSVSLHHVITFHNAMFDHMDGVTQALAKKKSQSMDNLYFVVKVARQTLSIYYAEVAPMTGMLLISAHIHYPFQKLRSFRQCDKVMHINPEDKPSYTTHYQEPFLKYVENEYCAKYQRMSVIIPDDIPQSNYFPAAMASQFGQSSVDPYDLPSDNEEYLTPKSVAEMTPGRSDCAARLSTAARLYLNSLPEYWRQFNPDIDDYHSDPKVISSTL